LISGSQGAGIARAFVRKGYAVALLARSKDKLEALATDLRGSHDGAIAYAFPSDTSRASLQKAFDDIRSHEAYKGLRLATSIWHVKHSSRAPFLEVTEDTLDEMMQTYIKGAYACFSARHRLSMARRLQLCPDFYPAPPRG
jgi:short-subunit dehydrogenase